MNISIWDHAVAASSDAPGVQPGEGGSQPTLLLQLLGDPEWSDRYGIRQVNRLTAESWYSKYHYSRTAGAVNSDFYGFFLGDLASIVGIGFPANEFGVATKFGLEGFMGNREITRVAVHPLAPRNTASRSVSSVCRGLGFDWFFSYADTGQGHHGGIYQALGAVYVGLSEARGGFLLDGVPMHPRSVVHMFGTQARVEAARLASVQGRTLVYEDDQLTPKHTYILPVGPQAATIREHLRPFTKPYPKRTAV